MREEEGVLKEKRGEKGGIEGGRRLQKEEGRGVLETKMEQRKIRKKEGLWVFNRDLCHLLELIS